MWVCDLNTLLEVGQRPREARTFSGFFIGMMAVGLLLRHHPVVQDSLLLVLVVVVVFSHQEGNMTKALSSGNRKRLLVIKI